MGGKANAGVDLRLHSVVVTSDREREHVGRTVKDRLLPSCSVALSTLAGQDIGSITEVISEVSAGSGDTSTAAYVTGTLCNETELGGDNLQGLSYESGEDADLAPEGIAAGGNEQMSGSVAIENGQLPISPDLSSRSESKVDVDSVMRNEPRGRGRAAKYGASLRAPGGQTHEYRPPPALQLPDQSGMNDELITLRHGREIDCITSNFRLPATLVGSPSCQYSCHDGKASLDPNAKEYTPAPSPCISPLLPHSVRPQHIGVPSSYPFESGHIVLAGLDNRSMVFTAINRSESGMSTCASDIPMSFYGNFSQLAYGPGSVTPTAWASLEVTDLCGHQVTLSTGDHLVTRAGLAQPLQSSHPVRSIGIPPFQTMGLPSVGISLQNALPHPPVSGREHVSRAILLNGVPSSLTDEQLKVEMEKWGDVRTVVLDQKHQGLVTVNFYDLRCAKEALRDIQQQHLNKQQRMQQQFQLSRKPRGTPVSSNPREHANTAYDRQDTAMPSGSQTQCSRTDYISATPGKGLINGAVMWAQYTLPVGAAAGPDGMNQGTLVVFNLDIDTTMEHLKSVFEAYGDVKELRETPAKKQHKFVEFYDVRDASKALKALDGTEINGKRVKIEFSRPGGQAHKARALLQQSSQGTTLYHPLSGGGSSLVGSGPSAVGSQPFYLNLSGDAAGTPLTMPSAHGGTSYLWTSDIGTSVPHSGVSVPQRWSSNGSQLSNYDYASMQAGSTTGAGPLVVMGDMKALSFGSRAMAIPYYGGQASPGDFFSSGQGLERASNVVRLHGKGDGFSSRRKRNSTVNMCAGYGKVDPANPAGIRLREGPRVGTRISTNKLSTRADIQPQYVFDEAGAQANETQRTTLMIKNIPNKYSQQMLLSLLDNHCAEWITQAEDLNEPESAYDFVYLPIDFKNKCNLGYAFVNFTSIQATMRLYRDFHLQQWEEFNSRKVCHVTYARVQGRLALEEHFKNSRFACDTDDYLPLIFQPPRNGKNTSSPATVPAVHQLYRVLGNSVVENGNRSSNGEKSGDDLFKGL